MARNEYKTFGPHVVLVPGDLEIKPNPGCKMPPAFTPINEVLNDKGLEGWELVAIIQGFPIQIPQSTLASNGMRQVISLNGVCALMTRSK